MVAAIVLFRSQRSENALTGEDESAIPLPKLVHCLRDYTLGAFAADAIAGVTVGLVALPLAMAFAIASGVAPQLDVVVSLRRSLGTICLKICTS